MKEPVKLPRPDVSQQLPASSTAAPRRGRAATGYATRPRSPVPGGKAMARINFFHLERGTATGSSPSAATPRPSVVNPNQPSPAENLVAGFNASRAQMAAPPTAAAVAVAQTWQPLGPFLMPHGQTYGAGPDSRPAVSGRVASVAVDPNDADHVLCGTAGGGVWETADGGRTWNPRTDDQPSLAVGAVAFDPANPLRVFAGTGEGNTAPSPAANVRAAGLLASTDGGTTWAVVPGTPFVGVSFYELHVDPADGNRLFAATTNGLYTSPDGGGTWTRRRTARCWGVSQHPVVPTNPSAANEVFAASADGLFRSTNGGANWSAVTLPGTPATPLVRMTVAHAPINGSVAYAFAAYDQDDGTADPPPPLPKLWRRATFGGAFTAVTPPADLETGQAWYDWFLGVAPNSSDVVYLGAINVHRGIRQPSGVWAWTNVSAKSPTGHSIHPDQHAIAFSPTDANAVYVGNDGGVYRSPDAGTTWESLNKGLCITEIEFLTQHPDYDAWLLAGTQDNGTIRYEGQQTWYQVQDGDGGDCGIDRTEPATCYHSFYGAYVEKSTAGGGWATWDGTVPTALANERSLFYPPLEVNGKLVVRGATRVWISRDGGSTWTANPLPGLTGFPSSLAAPSQDVVYAGTASGEMYRLARTGTTWGVTALTSPASGYVSDLLADSGLWATVNSGGSGRVFHSTDDGLTWTDRSAGIPPTVTIHAVEIDRANPNTLFVGTDVGVYRTTDGGVSWTLLARGLPNVLVKDLALHDRTRLLRAGTQARGVWELALDPVAMPDVAVYLRDHAADTGRVTPSADDAPNPFQPGGTNLFWWQSPDIKIDATPFHAPTLDDLDFAAYSDDRLKEDGGIEFATGLFDERPVRGQTVRVYVQVHNRGSRAATNVAVRVFAVPAALTWPDLPAGFWTNFPANTLPAASPWQPVAAHRVIPNVPTGRSVVVGFNWAVPMTTGPSVGLLAVISADNDSIAEAALGVADLVRNSRYCALRNYAVVNPSTLAGRGAIGMAFDVWPAAGPQSLAFDTGGRALVRGVVLDKSFVGGAKKAGWKAVALTAAEREFLTQLTDRTPALKARLASGQAWHPRGGSTLPLDVSGEKTAKPVVLLFNAKSKSTSGSLMVTGAGAIPHGGLTIVRPDS